MSEPMTRGYRRALVALFLLMALFAGLNLLFTARQVRDGEHKWCTTLELLTAHPVPRPADPKANPSRENAWIFYTDFLQLRRTLGCS